MIGENVIGADNQQETKDDGILEHYLLGFADAEGCFNVSVKRQESAKFGWVLDPLFQVTQHKSGREILEQFQQTLKCGRIIEKPGQKDLLLFLVDNRKQIAEKVLPFFEKYKPILKAKDFAIFNRVVRGLEKKEHGTREGFENLLRKIFEMNLAGKQRRYKLEQIIKTLGSSETIRRTSVEADEDIVRSSRRLEEAVQK